jgi:hypothetical protein
MQFAFRQLQTTFTSVISVTPLDSTSSNRKKGTKAD